MSAVATRWPSCERDRTLPKRSSDERAATRSREVTLHDTRIRVLSPEDTAVFKMLFFRGKDLVDLERLLGLMGKSLDSAYVRAALVEVVGEDDYRTKDLVRQLV